jgi:hypothetical protein
MRQGLKRDQALTVQIRDLLISHIDGPVPLYNGIQIGSIMEKTERYFRLRLLVKVVEFGWLAFDRKVSPEATLLTDKGKEILCQALADWADALTRARWEQPGLGFVPETALKSRDSEKGKDDGRS